MVYVQVFVSFSYKGERGGGSKRRRKLFACEGQGGCYYSIILKRSNWKIMCIQRGKESVLLHDLDSKNSSVKKN